MSSQILSQVVGLLQNETFPDWWKSQEVPIPFLDDKKLSITFMNFEPEVDKTFLSEADEAITNFLALDKSYRESISHLVYKNCKDFLEAIGFDEADQALWEIKDEKDI
jgi:hypothetical protein